MAAVAGATSGISVRVSEAQQVPNSTGTEPAKLKAPASACDCHMHIYDPRFPESNPRPGSHPKTATVQDYRTLQERTGTPRGTVVPPRNYATHHRVTRDPLPQLVT